MADAAEGAGGCWLSGLGMQQNGMILMVENVH